MKVTELNRDQLIMLKQRSLIDLADAGKFAKTFNVDYDEPSLGDIINADSLITDEEIIEMWKGTDFVESDFFI